MIQNIAFIGLFLLWLIGPAVAAARAWQTPQRVSAVVGMVAWWALLFMVLLIMHHVTHGGIFRLDFWWS